MIFEPTPISGVLLVRLERQEDERGFFARTFCRREFAAHGLATEWVQHNLSHNRERGTLRGLHWQAAPFEEVKLVHCTSGRIWDVFVDLRPGSPTYRRHHGVELSAADHDMLYLPGGLAHGFLTLTDFTEVSYLMGEEHHAEAARGVRWNDPAFGIGWPEPVRVISPRDASWPDWKDEEELPS